LPGDPILFALRDRQERQELLEAGDAWGVFWHEFNVAFNRLVGAAPARVPELEEYGLRQSRDASQRLGNAGVFTLLSAPALGAGGAARPSARSAVADVEVLGLGEFGSARYLVTQPSNPVRTFVATNTGRASALFIESAGAPAFAPAAAAGYLQNVGSNLSGRAIPTRGIWDLTPELRWTAVEQRLGANLPRNYPTIDRFRSGSATSIKSMDLGARTYADPANITRVGQGYVDAAAGFEGRRWANVEIRSSDIGSRGLDIAIPLGPTPIQARALDAVIEYGRKSGVNVNVMELH
jgi:hypothetical protein